MENVEIELDMIAGTYKTRAQKWRFILKKLKENT